MKETPPELALSRLLQAFETELIEADDDEIAAALADLGMRAGMKGSAASFDLRALRRLAWLHRWPRPGHESHEDENSPAVDRPELANPSGASDRSDR